MKFKFILVYILIFSFFAQKLLSDEREYQIFKNLRCLVCQGQSVAESNSDFAQTLKLVVRDQIKEGKTDKEIYNFLIDKYGEWIFYKPKMNIRNFLLWFLPYYILVIGGLVIFNIVKRKRKLKE